MRLYIDPGTGSMLFTILIGVLGAAVYALRESFVKLRFFFSGGKTDKALDSKIPIAIFSDSKRYWNVFEPICDEFERRGEALVYMTASPDDPALEKAYEHVQCRFIGEGNHAYAKLNTLRAEIVLSSTPSLDVFYWKRSKNVKWYVHIAHAASDLIMYRMFGIDYYDAILTSGQFQQEQVRALEKVRGLPEKEFAMVGLTYLDTMKARLDESGPAPAHDTTILLAPSWGESAILRLFGGEFIQKLLDTGYHVIVRPHPQSFTAEKEMMDALMAEFPDSEQLEWNRDNDNFEVLRRSDIMISDFSGVIFDFCLVFDKPVIYTDTEYDKAPYDACWLEEEPWTFDILPRIGRKLTAESMNDIRGLIDSCLTDPELQRGRDQARRECWEYPGEGAARTADYLLRKCRELQSEDAAPEA